MSEHTNFGTEAEKMFIRSLGRSRRSQASGISRLDLLRFHRFALKRRENFGSIDREEILKFVDDQIAAAENADL